jgi:hypothetical protein
MKILKHLAAVSLIIWVILLTSCKHEPELIPGSADVCFDNQVLPIIKTSCAISGCHTGSGERFGLSTYEQILKQVTPGKPIASKLHKVMIGNPNSENFMPPKGSGITLSSKQIDIISLWILQGARNTLCDTVPCDPENATFSGTIMPIMESYCVGCHNTANPSGGFVLTDYATIKSAIDGGRLIGAVEQLSGYTAMPKNSDKLSDCKIAQINKWINDGMPNN